MSDMVDVTNITALCRLKRASRILLLVAIGLCWMCPGESLCQTLPETAEHLDRRPEPGALKTNDCDLLSRECGAGSSELAELERRILKLGPDNISDEDWEEFGRLAYKVEMCMKVTGAADRMERNSGANHSHRLSLCADGLANLRTVGEAGEGQRTEVAETPALGRREGSLVVVMTGGDEDSAVTDYRVDSGAELNGSADSNPSGISTVRPAVPLEEGPEGPGGGGFSSSVGADGNALSGRELVSSEEIEEMGRKKITSSVKNPKFLEKNVKITPSADFTMEGSGELAEDVVRKYVGQQMAKIRWCYQKAFEKNPNLDGELTVSFVVSPTGSVMSAKVVSSTLDDDDLEGCIENKVLTWRFPAPKGGGVVKINYQFALLKT